MSDDTNHVQQTTGNKEKETGDDDAHSDEAQELPDLLFKVLLVNPSEGVKISKKNICIVKISQQDT
jgi:hypothetical protein